VRNKFVFALIISLFFSITFSMVSISTASGIQASVADFPISTDSGTGCIGGSPSIAYDGTNFLTAWIKDTNIYGARINKDGSVLDPDGISISVGLNGNTNNYRQPSVAFDGTNYFVVWVSTRNGNSDVYGCRVTKEGQVLDPQGIKLTTAGNVYVKPVGIAFDGTNYLLIWRTQGSVVMGERFTPDGTVLDNQAGFKIADNGYYPSVAFDNVDNLFMVVWHQGGFGSLTVHGARVDTSGNLLTPNNFLICDDPMDKENARIAFDGTNFMVIWYDWRPNSDQIIGSCYGTRITPQADVLDKPAFKVADGVRGQIFPNIVFDGTNYVAVWCTDSYGANKFRLSDVYMTRISTGGQILDRQVVPVSTAFEHQFGASIGYGNDKYLVAWNDARMTRNGGNHALYARILDKGMDTKQSMFENQSLPEVDWTSETFANMTESYFGTAFSDDDAYLFCNNTYFKFNNGIWNDMGNTGYSGGYAGYQTNRDNFMLGGWAGLVSYFNGTAFEGFPGVPNNIFIAGLWGIDRNNIWAALSSAGGLAHCTGGQWSLVQSDASVDVTDISGTNAADIYAVR
jgi:hypothetical protein